MEKNSQNIKKTKRTAWNRNIPTSELQKREIGIGRRGILKWIKDENLQKIMGHD